VRKTLLRFSTSILRPALKKGMSRSWWLSYYKVWVPLLTGFDQQLFILDKDSTFCLPKATHSSCPRICYSFHTYFAFLRSEIMYVIWW